MMDEKKIEQLLAAFYNGETTTEEEALLKNFLNSDDLPKRWHVDRDLFRTLSCTSEISLPKGLSERLEKSLDEHIASKKSAEKRHYNVRQLYIKITSIAAAVLLFAGLFFMISKPSSKLTADTFTDPQEAEQAATFALALVSTNLNKGLASLDKAQNEMNKTNKVVSEILNFEQDEN